MRVIPSGNLRCVVELCERFAGSLLGSLLLLYLNERIGLLPVIATQLGGSFNAAVYLSSVLGGLVADRWFGTRLAPDVVGWRRERMPDRPRGFPIRMPSESGPTVRRAETPGRGALRRRHGLEESRGARRSFCVGLRRGAGRDASLVCFSLRPHLRCSATGGQSLTKSGPAEPMRPAEPTGTAEAPSE